MPKKFFKKVGKGVASVAKTVARDVVKAVNDGNLDPVSIAQSVARRRVGKIAKRVGVSEAMGNHAGSKLDKGISAIVGKIKGRGDYQMTPADELQHNVLVHEAQGKAGKVPQFSAQSSKDGRSMMIAHREFIQDVQGSTTFNSRRFNCDPTDPAVFPWLSSIASLFQKYKFHGLVFEFNSTSSDALNSVNTALGTVIMTPQTNINSPPFANKRDMENTYGAISAKPSSSIICGVECAPALTLEPSWTRHLNDNNTNYDPRLYNTYGYVQYATVGMQSSGFIIGEVWCSYLIELIDPILNNNPGPPVYNLASHFALNGTVTGSDTTSLYFGEASTIIYNSINANIDYTANTITIPASSYSNLEGPIYIEAIIYLIGQANLSTQFPAITYTNATAFNLYTDISATPLSVANIGSQSVADKYFNLSACLVTDKTLDTVIQYQTGAIFPYNDPPLNPLGGDLFVHLFTPT